MSDQGPREVLGGEWGEELRGRLADAEDQRLRALADLDNLRKRCATQVSRARAEASSTVAAEWLPVVDNLDRTSCGSPPMRLARWRGYSACALPSLSTTRPSASSPTYSTGSPSCRPPWPDGWEGRV